MVVLAVVMAMVFVVGVVMVVLVVVVVLVVITQGEQIWVRAKRPNAQPKDPKGWGVSSQHAQAVKGE